MTTLTDPAVRKTILSIDGGGVRGLIAIEMLLRLETMLRQRTGNPHLVLADVFDFAAGASTGAIVAAGVARGLDVEAGRRFFFDHAKDVFKKSWKNLTSARYSADVLAERLKALYGAKTRLGSPEIRTLLMVVTHNATTDSPWFLTNNPHARFNAPGEAQRNLDLEVWRAVKASAAAPTFFPPEVLPFGDDGQAVFVDGALTGFNNPAFKAFTVATAAPYGMGWSTGVDKLTLVSVGTGVAAKADRQLSPARMHYLYTAQNAPRMMLAAADAEQDLLCRIFGRCIAGPPIDAEVGDMRTGAVAQMFTYARFNPGLDDASLAALGCGDVDADRIAALDAVDQLEAMSRIGAAAAEAQVTDAVLDQLFDL